MLYDPSHYVNEPKPYRFHPLVYPRLSEHKPFHQYVEVERQNHYQRWSLEFGQSYKV